MTETKQLNYLGSTKTHLLMFPMELTLSISLFVTAVVFLIFPDALEHSPIAFDPGGAVHHIWHAALGIGAFFTFISHSFSDNGDISRRMRIAGLCMLFVAMIWNFSALAVHEVTETPVVTGGLGFGLRAAIIMFLAIRIWILITRPVIRVQANA